MIRHQHSLYPLLASCSLLSLIRVTGVAGIGPSSHWVRQEHTLDTGQVTARSSFIILAGTSECHPVFLTFPGLKLQVYYSQILFLSTVSPSGDDIEACRIE